MMNSKHYQSRNVTVPGCLSENIYFKKIFYLICGTVNIENVTDFFYDKCW